MAEHSNSPAVLLVENNAGDVRLTQEAFDDASIDAELHVVRDGQAALDFLHRRGEYEDAPRPDLVLLDLNLPRIGGLAVLDEIKADPDLKLIPVLVLTGSDAEGDRRQCYEAHANAYLTKPVDPQEFFELVRTVAAFWFEFVRLPTTPD